MEDRALQVEKTAGTKFQTGKSTRQGNARSPSARPASFYSPRHSPQKHGAQTMFCTMMRQEACVRMAKPTPRPRPGYRETRHGHEQGTMPEAQPSLTCLHCGQICPGSLSDEVNWLLPVGDEEIRGPGGKGLSTKTQRFLQKHI